VATRGERETERRGGRGRELEGINATDIDLDFDLRTQLKSLPILEALVQALVGTSKQQEENGKEAETGLFDGVRISRRVLFSGFSRRVVT